MTNKEKYGNDIIELAIDEGVLALKNGEPALCAKIKCEDSCNCKHNNNSRDNEPCYRCDSKQTNADRIRSMTDEEMAERIASSSNFNCADYCDSFTKGCTFNCGKKEIEIALKWLQSEAE